MLRNCEAIYLVSCQVSYRTDSLVSLFVERIAGGVAGGGRLLGN